MVLYFSSRQTGSERPFEFWHKLVWKIVILDDLNSVSVDSLIVIEGAQAVECWT